MPASIALIYFSATGNTARLAEAVGQGARGTVEVLEFRITGADIVNGRFRNVAAMALVDGAAAVLFGSPNFMGGADADERSRWGAQMGVVSQAVDGVLDARDLATAKYLGQRVARLAAPLAAMGPPQPGP